MNCNGLVMNRELEFVGNILDVVHGFIPYTAAEKRILNAPLFKRLQDIKQLSVVDWVFPGAEHTRYIHSLGVMHIADRIARQLKLDNDQRRILRFAGLLHDIGHYPLSHVVETAYKKNHLSAAPDIACFCQESNESTASSLSSLANASVRKPMQQSNGAHHEAIGKLVIESSDTIKQIITEECNEEAIGIITDIITGNTDNCTNESQLLVQILHSELDADGIDYLMRDALFSGTGINASEIEHMLRCLCAGQFNGKPVLCITPKGISDVDHYFINKFQAYQHVVFNRHVVISELMAETVVAWMQANHVVFPTFRTLQTWIAKAPMKFLQFNDRFFWNAVQQIAERPSDTVNNADNETIAVPDYIKLFCQKLVSHEELAPIKNRDESVVFDTAAHCRNYVNPERLAVPDYNSRNILSVLSFLRMCKQIPNDCFMEWLEKQKNNSETDDDLIRDKLEQKARMEWICVMDKSSENVHFLCDDHRSLMQQLYKTQIAILHNYSCE